VRSNLLLAELLDSQRRRKMGEVAMLENPLGSETGTDLLACELAESCVSRTRRRLQRSILAKKYAALVVKVFNQSSSWSFCDTSCRPRSKS